MCGRALFPPELPMKTQDCCPDWGPNCAKINGPIILHSIRTGFLYAGIAFRFCPWCGTKRPDANPEAVAVAPSITVEQAESPAQPSHPILTRPT